MALKIFQICIILCVILSKFRISCSKYDQISVCEPTSDTCIGCRYVKFICGDISREGDMFTYSSDAIGCRSQGFYKKYFGMVDFANCRYPVLVKRNYFDLFNALHRFNITDMEIESLTSTMFQNAKSLTHLLASQNRITEIPSLLFISASKLTHVDFANNSIKHVDALAFVGANVIDWIDLSHNQLTELDQQFKILSNLKTLNISHNQISTLNSHILCTPNLQTLDISYNNLSELDENTFENTTHLKSLNLSFNPIGLVKVTTFVYLTDLEHLNLKHANIFHIHLGTFSHQHKLITLDLSGNGLKELDCKLFFPIMHDLRSILLGGNQLTEIIGFRNALFPNLELLDIISNQFNCSYLHYFMENVNWEKLHLHLVPKPVKPGETSIRGISCTDTINESDDGAVKYEQEYETKDLESILSEGFPKLNVRTNDDVLTHILLVLIFIVICAYLTIFLIINRDRILYKYQENRPPHVRTTSVVFNNEQNEQNETLLF